MALSENKNESFIKAAGLLTLCFQAVFFYFYSKLPVLPQVLLSCSLPGVIASVILANSKQERKISSYLYVISIFAQEALTYILLSDGNEIDIGSAFMIGSLSILASVLIGVSAGIVLTVATIAIILTDIYLINFSFHLKEGIQERKLYELTSILQPSIIVNFLTYHFYHAFAQEKKDKNELKYRLAKVLDNSLQTIVLIDKKKKILYADIKSRELAKSYLGLDLNEGEESINYIPAEFQSNFIENVDKAFLGEKITLERRVDLPDNNVFWFMVMYSPLYDLVGNVDSVQFSLIDISAQKHVQEELQKAEERWKYALTSSMDGVWDWSVKDGKAYFSKMYKEMLGYKESEIKDSFAEWEKLIHPEDKQKSFEEVLKHVKNQTKHFVLEHRLLQKNNEYKWILARGKIIERDEHGNPVRFIGTHTDIDHIKKVESDLKAAQEKAEQAAEAKSQFLSTISHEIRTPLNAVIGFSNLLLREDTETQNFEYLKNIQTSANHLLSLVNNVLDISKIESGKIEFESREFDLSKLLDENIAMLSLRAAEKNIHLAVSNTVRLENFLVGDPFRLTQILNNLLGNAVKFTDKGKVELSAEITEESAEEVVMKFTVSDTGPGISANKQEAIFESFTQASTETARKYGGTGLGLSISKHLVTLQGGNIGVNSQVGEGSRFFFTLKFKKGNKIVSSSLVKINDKEDSLSGLKILVAEDNIFNTKVLTRFLELWKAEFEVAENGEQVLEWLEKKEFDLILMDLHMPKMDGYEATNAIRKSGNSIIIIALTASASFSSQEDIKSKGFDNYFYKPVNIKDLFTKLKEIQLGMFLRLPA